MGVPSLFQPNVTQELISTMIRSMVFAAYADVMEVKGDSVVVQSCVCNGAMSFTTLAKVVYPTTANVQVSFEPSVGDKVLVIGLQSYSDEMFKSDIPLLDNAENAVQHYTILGCVAIPMNIEDSKVPLRVSDGDFKIESANKHGITINEGDDPVVRWSELKAVLQDLWYAYNMHFHDGGGHDRPSNPWMFEGEDPPSPTGAPSFIDLASEHLAVPHKQGGNS